MLSTASVACESQCCQQPALHVKVSVVDTQRDNHSCRQTASVDVAARLVVDKQPALMFEQFLSGEGGGGGSQRSSSSVIILLTVIFM